MKCLFIVPCKYINLSPVKDCLQSIKCFHEDADIALVDSCSDDISYLDDIKESARYIFLNNKHYADGALWTSYESLKDDYDHFILLQDSIILKQSLKPWINDKVHSMSWFPAKEEHPRDTRMLDLLKKFTGLSASKPEWSGVFGPVLIFPKEALGEVYDLGVSNLLPITKSDHNSMERVWGIILEHLGHDIVTNCVEGRLTKHFNVIEKRFFERS